MEKPLPKINSRGHRNWRKEKAARRAEIRADRTSAEQLLQLLERGHGKCKEAERLRKHVYNIA